MNELEAFLATLQSRAEVAIETLGEKLVAELSPLETGIEDCATKLSSLVEDSETQIGSLDELLNALEEEHTELFETLEQDVEECLPRCQAVHNSLIEGVTSQWGDLQSECESKRDDVIGSIKESWQTATSDLTNLSGTLVSETLEEQVVQFTQAGEVFTEAIEHTITDLKQLVGVEMVAFVKREGQKTIDSAIGRLKDEVTQGIITSQVQVQLTSFLSPYVVQLATAKRLAPVIRRALDIMRGGF